MKNARILAAVAASAAVVGLSACGNTSTGSASPVPPDKGCAEVTKPNDPNNLIGREWPWMSDCSALDDVTPGVDRARAEAVVFDARQRVVAAKMAISVLASQGNKLNDPQAQQPYRAKIEDIRGRLAGELVDSRLALQGTPPEGFSLDYRNSPNPLSCADAWDFKACVATGGAEKGQPPSYLTHSASPGMTGEGR